MEFRSCGGPRVAMLGVAMLAAACGGGTPVSETLPNIVLIYADDLGWSDSGAYGNGVIKTPNIDRLAAEGVLFERAYTAAPSCSASRAALLTGRYPHTNGVISLLQWNNRASRNKFPTRTLRTHRHTMARGETLLSQDLKRLGYSTALLGKWHVSIEKPTTWGFDRRLATTRDLEKLESAFFLYHAPFHTHRPFRANADFRYDPNDLPLPPYFREDAELRVDLARYYSAVSNLDREVGEVLEWLDESGHTDDTIVVLASDHGPPYARAKATLYEWGVRIPLIIRYPRALQGGGRTQALASTIDIYPTLLELIGQPIPERLQGTSLVRNLKDPQLAGREAVFFESNYYGYYKPSRAVRTGRWKYIRNYITDAPFPNGEGFVGVELLLNPLPTPPRAREELYDLEEDPFETVNRVADPRHKAALNDARMRLDDWMQQTDDDPARELAIEPAQSKDWLSGWHDPEQPLMP